jgi:hypothetical protein
VEKVYKPNVIEWVLRVGVFGTFIGHGCTALLVKPSWIILVTAFGFSSERAAKMLPLIGVLDIIIAFTVLLKPYKIVLYWAVFWAFITALSRIIAGQGVPEFMERFSNIACPLALLIFINVKEKAAKNYE